MAKLKMRELSKNEFLDILHSTRRFQITAAKNVREMAEAIEPGLMTYILESWGAGRLSIEDRERVQCVPASVNSRIKKTLGRVFHNFPNPEASRPNQTLELSGRLTREGSFDEIRKTFLHEVAHVIDNMRTRGGCNLRQSHGVDWQWIAKALDPTITRLTQEADLSYDIPTKRRAIKVVGRCIRCGDHVKRANRLKFNRDYTHTAGGCGGKIQPKYTA